MEIAEQKMYTLEDIYNLPDGQRAELIDGAIYFMARLLTGLFLFCGG